VVIRELKTGTLDEILRHIHDVRDSGLYLLGMHRLAV
jgi:hypothetical protein